MAFASRSGDRAQTRGYPGTIVRFECWLQPILQHAAGFDQRRGLFGELGDSVHDTATSARHEAQSRDIFLGDLVDRDPASPAVSGLAMAWYRVANRTRTVILTAGP